MTLQNVLALAKQGNVQAIDLLLNQMLKPKGVTARTVLKDQRLHLLLESPRPLNQASLVPAIHRMISKLDTSQIRHLTVYGRQTGQQGQSWSQVIDLQDSIQGSSLSPDQVMMTPQVAKPDRAEERVEEATANQTTADPKLPVFTPAPPPPPERRNNFPPAAPPKADHHSGRAASKNRQSDQVRKPAKQEDLTITSPTPPPVQPVAPNLPNTGFGSSSPHHFRDDRPQAVPGELEPLALNHQRDDDRVTEVAEEGWPTISPAPAPAPQPSGELSLLRSVAVVGMAVLLGGIVWFQGTMISRQASATVQEATNIAVSVGDPTQAKTLADLKADEEKLKAAIEQLKLVPQFPLFSNTQVQVLTPSLEVRLEKIQNQIKQEEQAAQNLESAKQLAKQAVATVKASPQAESNLKQAESQWQQAIDRLTAIPDQTFVSEAAQATLVNYQNNLAEIRKQIETSQKSAPRRLRR